MTEEIQAKALDMIEQLAIKMGVAVDQLWATLVAQAKVEAISDIIWILIMLVPFIISVIIFLNFNKKRKEMEIENKRMYKNEYERYAFWKREIYVDYEDQSHASLIAVIISSMMLFFSMISIRDIITNLINPNMYAIKYLTEILQ